MISILGSRSPVEVAGGAGWISRASDQTDSNFMVVALGVGAVAGLLDCICVSSTIDISAIFWRLNDRVGRSWGEETSAWF